MGEQGGRFTPSRAAQERANGRAGQPPNLTEEEKAQRLRDGISLNYRGDATLESNKCRAIPDSENCHLYVTGFPRNITTADLMETLEGHGEILKSCIERKPRSANANIMYACHEYAENLMKLINSGGLHLRRAPEPGASTAAATAAAAGSDDHENLLAARVQGLDLTGVEPARPTDYHNSGSNSPQSNRIRLRARWNRRGTVKKELKLLPPFSRTPTRVLLLKGTAKSMSRLDKFISDKVACDIDRVIDHGIDEDGKVCLEYRFGSWLCMVDQVVKALRNHMSDIELDYGEDPCGIKPTEKNGDVQNPKVILSRNGESNRMVQRGKRKQKRRRKHKKK
ncbi:hypothetical protein F5Y09DRAFT_307158 [Xylaria sp. FL1042]|nr:hypothetical protein F5Y09DRAFT_307158 [Xylaria sp. FL1042]